MSVRQVLCKHVWGGTELWSPVGHSAHRLTRRCSTYGLVPMLPCSAEMG